jgi:1,4-dihydroxy-2-naphthoate octaprenyltransferase
MMQGSVDHVLAVPAPAPAGGMPSPVAPGSIGAWLMALRPRSLVIAVSPVVAAMALIWSRGDAIDPMLALLVFAAAVMMQVITNLQNDVGYTLRGGEKMGTRIGLPRATGLGLLTPRQVRVAIAVAIVITLALGLPLVMARGTPVMLMGLASILAALAYMGGPRPIAYTPLGELTVMVFFGFVAVVGTDYALTGGAGDPVLWLAAAALGGIATAAIVVNNARDWEHDRSVGRVTLAVAAGRRAMDGLFGLLVLGPTLLLLPMAWLAQSPWLLLPAILAPSCLRLARDFARCPPGLPYNGVLFRTFLMELKFAALLVLGAVLARLV